MAKIPVGSTIAYAYSFTFGNFLTILGLSWLPLAIAALGAYFVIPPYFIAFRNMAQNQDPSGIPGAAGLLFLFSIVAFICFSMVYIAISRQALGLRTGIAFFYFSLDRAVWALLGAYLLAMLAYLGIVIAIAIAVGILAAIAALALGPVGSGLITGLAVAVSICAIFYAAFRAMFLLAPVAAAEERHVLRRSWTLGAGNFWRIFVIFLVLIVPIVIVQFIVMAIFGANVAIMPPPPGASPEQVAAFLDQLGEKYIAALPVLAPIGFVFNVFIFGMMSSAQAFAYRALVPITKPIAETFT